VQLKDNDIVRGIVTLYTMGTFTDDFWLGYCNVHRGFRKHLSELRETSIFRNPWVKTQYLLLLNHEEYKEFTYGKLTHDENRMLYRRKLTHDEEQNMVDTINTRKLAQFPDHVLKCIQVPDHVLKWIQEARNYL